MVPSLSIELNNEQQSGLLELARESIALGLNTHHALKVEPANYRGVLAENLASFVTLTLGGALRGCIGSLTATRPLAQDVANAAFSAAFKDPRFSPLSEQELESVLIEISVLSVPEPLDINNEEELLSQLVPHRDGLVLEDREHRATFLPKVWEHLPQAKTFLTQLKHKAGLPADYWSDTLCIYRYRTHSFSETSQ